MQGCGEEGAVKVKLNGKEADTKCAAKKFSIGGKADEKGDACCEEITFKDETDTEKTAPVLHFVDVATPKQEKPKKNAVEGLDDKIAKCKTALEGLDALKKDSALEVTVQELPSAQERKLRGK